MLAFVSDQHSISRVIEPLRHEVAAGQVGQIH
jgi:hypothetical protein